MKAAAAIVVGDDIVAAAYRSKGRIAGIEHAVELGQSPEEAFREIVERLGVGEDTPVVAGIGGHGIETDRYRSVIAIRPPGRSITEEDRANVVAQATRALLPPDRDPLAPSLQPYEVDGRSVEGGPIGLEGELLAVEVVVPSLDRLQWRQTAGVLDDLEAEYEALPRGAALALAASSPDHRQVGLVAVRVGPLTTDIAIYVAGRLRDAVAIEHGAAHVQADLAKILRCNYQNAGDLFQALETLDPDQAQGELRYRRLGEMHPRTLRADRMALAVAAALEPLFSAIRARVLRAAGWDRLRGGLVVEGNLARKVGFREILGRYLPETRVDLPRNVVTAHEEAVALLDWWPDDEGNGEDDPPPARSFRVLDWLVQR